ncbi:SusC/RagA family TonB-linked outer membrane protein [Dyadobacter sediminis]|uniref:SusC/RagA family TonB-linked outer membrane protein n=2 Tax=Dyadobacter sediminis TaxID=1493691 RepID=A0A5R9K330_9BACT|nr:SusC/RagA family TonB-linked outer membrane protein [Dyadobacter sediminis]TLU88828.1 SusC/RagA family TonB-linked outer membrane protein [Dyadobacter sediminis]
MKKRILLMVLLLLSVCSMHSYAQEMTVTGKVTEEAGGEVAGVNVVVKGSSRGTTTNDKGEYSISVEKGKILTFSFIGFNSKEVTVGSESIINVSLTPEATALNEVVVTALGIKREKKALGYAVSELKGEELVQARSTNMANTLVGKVAGLNITSTATGPGGSTRITLRGNGSIDNNNQPLIIIDGIPIDNSNLGAAGMWGGGDRGDGISSLNPSEIESMSVLKGATAAALYGSRASNGAILVTTKGGKAGKGIGVEINSNITTDDLLITKFKDFQYEYGMGRNGVKPTTREEAMSSSSFGAKLDGSSVIQYDGVSRPYSAVKDNLTKFYKTGSTFNNSVALTGATENITYRLSLANMNNKGLIPDNTLDRQNYSLNVNGTLSKNLSILANVKYIKEKSHNRPRVSDSPGNANYTLVNMPTTLSVETMKQSMLDDRGYEQVWGDNIYVDNAYFAATQFQQDDNKDRFIVSFEPRYNFTDWLYAKARVGFDKYFYNYTAITPTGTPYQPLGGFDKNVQSFSEVNSELLFGINRKLVGDLNLNMLIAGNLMKQVVKQDYISGSSFNIPFFYDITNINPASRNASYNYIEKRINSVYGSAEFSYKSYAYVTVTGRNDWFSTLAPGKNSLFYPSIAGSFVLSEAIRLPSVISYAKLRGSWAKAGGDTNPYRLSLYYGLSGAHIGSPLAQINGSTVPYAGLQPLRSYTYELGLENRLFNNRLGLDFTYYDRQTKDDIVAASISGTSGFTSVLLNVGQISNRGVELMLNYDLIKNKNFTWDISYNLGYNKSNVVFLGDGLESIQVDNPRSQTAYVFQQVGQPFSLLKATSFVRDDQGRIVYNAQGLPLKGDLKPYGTGISPYTMGFTTNFRYKGVGLSVLFDGRFGGHLYSGTNALATRYGLSKESLVGRETGVVGEGVNEEGEINTVSVPATQYYENLYNFGEPFIYKSDFIKLRQVILDYSIPARVFGRSPFKGVSVSLVGRNLAILMKKTPNIDPESTYGNGNAQGYEFAGVPTTRSIGVNLNLKF